MDMRRDPKSKQVNPRQVVIRPIALPGATFPPSRHRDTAGSGAADRDAPGPQREGITGPEEVEGNPPAIARWFINCERAPHAADDVAHEHRAVS